MDPFNDWGKTLWLAIKVAAVGFIVFNVATACLAATGGLPS